MRLRLSVRRDPETIKYSADDTMVERIQAQSFNFRQRDFGVRNEETTRQLDCTEKKTLGISRLLAHIAALRKTGRSLAW
jgi:hypothetical protein